MNKSFANERCAFAFQKVSDIKDAESLQKYRSLVRSLPAIILSNGYGLAMAYLYSNSINGKGRNKAFDYLYGHIKIWLIKQRILLDNGKDLISNIADSDKDTYRLLESETLTLLEWLKRFAEGASIV